MDILLTGCAGFIGARVASLLLEEGHNVAGMDNLDDSAVSRLTEWRLESLRQREGFSFHQVDISNAEGLKSALSQDSQLRRVSAIINLGALAGVRGSVENPEKYYRVNLLGVLNLLNLGRDLGIGKFIQASTSSVYGGGVDGPVREDADSSRPLSPYAASKKAAETLVYSYHHLHGIGCVNLRYFTVYGPAGRPDMSIFRFIRSIAEGQPITVFGDGTQQRDFTYVDDIARGTGAALGISGYETVNLGFGKPVALNAVIEEIELALGKRAEIEYEPRHIADPMVTWADIGHARDVLSWEPTVDLKEGIRRTVEWYRANRDWARSLA